MEKTEAIILSNVKYGDNKLILNTYARESGRMTISVAIPKAPNRPSALPYCQPLFQNEIEYTAHGNIRRAHNITPAFTYKTIPYDTAKMTVAMFLAEILTKTLTYSEKNEDLYNFLATSLQLLDDPNYKGLNFHIKFLIQLTKYMGFDIGAKHKTTPQDSLIFNKILESDFISCENLQLTGNTRSNILQKTLDYYRFHFETLDNIRSLEVLQKIYH